MTCKPTSSFGHRLLIGHRRGRLAELFLDTPQCNAHTTGCDILWSGTPMITIPGTKMATRVASSLLRASDLEELVCNNLNEYEELAVKLAVDDEMYMDIRRKVNPGLTMHNAPPPISQPSSLHKFLA